METLRWSEQALNLPGRIIDNYWATEIGSPLSALSLGLEGDEGKVCYGSANKLVAGVQAKIFDNLDEHQDENAETKHYVEVENGKQGHIFIKLVRSFFFCLFICLLR